MTNARTAKSTREKAAELRAEAARAEARRRTFMITGAVAAVIAVLVAGVILVKTASDNAKARDVAASAPPANLFDGGILSGSSSAKVTIEAYEDFLCPACRSFETANAAQIDAWVKAGTVKVVYRPVAILDDRTTPAGYSTRALNAAAAVLNSSPTSFVAFHRALFDAQPEEGGPGLTDDKLIELAVTAGATKSAIEPVIREQKYKLWTQTSTDAFSKAGFNATPTIVVNGKKIADSAPATLKAAVEAAAK
ncbi:MAG: thioredoxin domain-containing protein [Kineosporiaceae bacterium]